MAAELNDVEQLRKPPRRLPGHVALLLISLSIGVITGVSTSRTLASYVRTNVGAHHLGTFEHGFVTERILPADMYEVDQYRFTGGVTWLPNGTEKLFLDPSKPSYVGDPSPAIDQAWDELVEARYWSIAESEAKLLWGVGYAQYRDQIKGGYTGGFDVFHILHCLNMIRKRLSPEYYPLPQYGRTKHDMHCIDQLRQRIQCSASGTITPARYFEYLPGMYVDSRQLHTCRNFNRLWEYTRERYNGSLAVRRIQWV